MIPGIQELIERNAERQRRVLLELQKALLDYFVRCVEREMLFGHPKVTIIHHP